MIANAATFARPTWEAPEHLAAAGRAFWLSVVEAFDLEPDKRTTLLLAAELADTAEACRKCFERARFMKDRFGQFRLNPAVEEHRRAAQAFILVRRELGLDIPDSNNALRGPASPSFR